MKHLIICYQTWKTENHSQICMAKRTQPQNKLENRRVLLEKLQKWKTSIDENQ